ncbi:MAG: HEPN domain-containing protein, partial [Pseudomonadota bacterium]
MEEFYGRRRNLIYALFVDRGDEDYLAARLLFWNGIARGSMWSAAQSVEKYVKAVLLLRGHSSKFGHERVWEKL